MKHTGMKLLAFVLALALFLPLALTSCKRPVEPPEPEEPKTAEGVLEDAMKKLEDVIAGDFTSFTMTDTGSAEFSVDLSGLLELLTGEKTDTLVAVKSYRSGVLQVFENIAGEGYDVTAFPAGDKVIFTSEKFFGDSAYFCMTDIVLGRIGLVIDSFADLFLGFSQAGDLYYYGIGEGDEDIWLVFDGAYATALYPMDEYVAVEMDGAIAMYCIADAVEVVPYEPADVFGNYTFVDGLNYAFGDDAMYGFAPKTECVVYSNDEYAVFYGNDGVSLIVFALDSYVRVEGEDAPEQEPGTSGVTNFAELLPEWYRMTRENKDDAAKQAETVKTLVSLIADAAKKSFAANHTLTLAEGKPLTVHNRELTVDEVTLRMTEVQILNIASDVLTAVRSDKNALEYNDLLAPVLGNGWAKRLGDALKDLQKDADENNYIDLTVSVDRETGLPAKAVLHINDVSKENEDVPRTESFDALVLELIDGYFGITANDEDAPAFGITTTWNTDAERTMTQTFLYVPMENDDGETFLGEQLMIDGTFRADGTYDISVVTDDLSMFSFEGTCEVTEETLAFEIATFSVKDGEMSLTLPVHMKLKLNAADTAPVVPENYEDSSDAVADLFNFFLPIDFF